jgi:thiamine biosynthesis lipoprotein
MQKSPSRRTFLLTMGALGAAAVGGVSYRLYARRPGSIAPLPGKLQTAQRTARALGCDIPILALHEDLSTANRALGAAFGELARIENVMSIYRPDSQVSQLNRTGVIRNPDPYLAEILQHAADMSRQSQGAFDVTVQPLWSLYASAASDRKLPTDTAVDSVRRNVDWQKVAITRNEIRLTAPNMAITLNGIAQGYAADKALLALKNAGIRHALVNAGEIATLGRKADGNPWVAGIQHPRQPDAYLGLARLEGRCVSTSGDYETTFSPDKSYNHIFDPGTGRSPLELASVTIIAPTATQADALSTAIFVMGTEKGLALAASLPAIDALLVTKSGKTLATRGFPWSA